MEDGNISEEELAKLLEGLEGEDLFGGEMIVDTPDAAAPASPAASGGTEKVLSQAEIDALLASMNVDND